MLNIKDVASLKIKDATTKIKGLTISTLKDGKIAIDTKENKKKDSDLITTLDNKN